MIVLDASAGVAVLLNLGAGAQRIREKMDLAGYDLHAPHLLEIELASVLRRYVLSASFSPARARLALDRLSTLKISLYPHTAMLPRI